MKEFKSVWQREPFQVIRCSKKQRKHDYRIERAYNESTREILPNNIKIQ